MNDLSIPKMNIEEEIKDIRFKLRNCPSLHSHDDKPLNDEIMFQRMELLFEDLKKVKAEIDEHLLDSLCVELSVNNGTKEKLEDIKEEYIRVLNDVEKGQNEVEKLKNTIDSLEKKSKKHKTIRRKNHKKKNAFVYHVRSCRNTPNRGIYAFGGVYVQPRVRCDEKNTRLGMCFSPSRISNNEFRGKSPSRELFLERSCVENRSCRNEKPITRDSYTSDVSIAKINCDRKDIKAYKIIKQQFDDVKIKTKPNLKKGWVRNRSEKQVEDPDCVESNFQEGSKYLKSNTNENSEKRNGENKSPNRYIQSKYVLLRKNIKNLKAKKLGEKVTDIESNKEKKNFITNFNKSNELPYSLSKDDKLLNSTNKEKQVPYENGKNKSKIYNFNQIGTEKPKKVPGLLKDTKGKKKSSLKNMEGKVPDIEQSKENLNFLLDKSDSSEFPYSDNEDDRISTNKFQNKEKPSTGKTNYKTYEEESGHQQFGTEKYEKTGENNYEKHESKTGIENNKSPSRVDNLRDKDKTSNRKKVGSKSPDIEQNENNYVLLKDPRDEKNLTCVNKIEKFIQNNRNLNITIGDLKKCDSEPINEKDTILESLDEFLAQEKPTTRNESYNSHKYDDKFRKNEKQEKSLVEIPRNSSPKTESTITQNLNLASENQELRNQISQLREHLFKLYNNNKKTEVDEKSNILTKNDVSKDSLNLCYRAGSQMSNTSMKKRLSNDPIIVLGKIDEVEKNYANSGNIDKTKPKIVLDQLNNKLTMKEKLIVELDEASKALEKACDQETNRLKDFKNQQVDTSHKLLRRSYEFDELLAENIKTKKILDDKHDDIRLLEDSNKRLNREKGALTYDKQKLMKQTGELGNKVKMLNEQSQKWFMSENRLKNLIDREKKSHEATKKDLDDAKKRMFQQLKEINAYNSDKELAVVKAAQLETSIMEMKKKLDDKEIYLKHLDTRTKGLEQELKRTNESYEIMIADQISQLKNLEKIEENIQPEIEMEKLLEIFNELKLTNSTLKEEFIKAGQENLNVQYEKLNLTKKHEDLENQVKKYKTELEKVKVSRKAKKLQLRELDGQLQSIASIKSTTDSKIKVLEQTIMESNKILQDLEDKFNRAEQENSCIAKSMENTNQDIYCLKKTNLELKAKLNQISNMDLIPSSSSCGNLNVPLCNNQIYCEEPIRLTKSEHAVKIYNDACDQNEDCCWRSDYLEEFRISTIECTHLNDLNDSNRI